jgi:hypothetical protein
MKTARGILRPDPVAMPESHLESPSDTIRGPKKPCRLGKVWPPLCPRCLKYPYRTVLTLRLGHLYRADGLNIIGCRSPSTSGTL